MVFWVSISAVFNFKFFCYWLPKRKKYVKLIQIIGILLPRYVIYLLCDHLISYCWTRRWSWTSTRQRIDNTYDLVDVPTYLVFMLLQHSMISVRHQHCGSWIGVVLRIARKQTAILKILQSYFLYLSKNCVVSVTQF